MALQVDSSARKASHDDAVTWESKGQEDAELEDDEQEAVSYSYSTFHVIYVRRPHPC